MLKRRSLKGFKWDNALTSTCIFLKYPHQCYFFATVNDPLSRSLDLSRQTD